MDFIKKYGIWLALLLVLILVAWHYDLIEKIDMLNKQNGKAPLNDNTPSTPGQKLPNGDDARVNPGPPVVAPGSVFPKNQIGLPYYVVATKYQLLYNVRRAGDNNLSAGLFTLKTLRLKTEIKNLIETVVDAWIE